MDCPMKYIGQTGRTFSTRYKEHIHDIRSNNSNSGYSNHILNTGHAYGVMTDGCNNNKEEGQTPKYIGKVPYIQNQQGKLTYE
jgi:hypothetical protein